MQSPLDAPRAVASLLQQVPQQRNQLIAALHAQQGNHFVQAVLQAKPAGTGNLPAPLRTQFEQALQTDLSAVTIHTDATAQQHTAALGAKAVTVGQDIYFDKDQYAPETPAGRELLAHEVAHAAQQQHAAPVSIAAATRNTPNLEASDQRYHAAERNADSAATAMLAGRKATIEPTTTAHAQRREYSRDELLAAIRAALARQDWHDTAIRLNGMSSGDIAMLVGRMSIGQLSHVREAAVAAMPGYSARVTDAIDAHNPNATAIAAIYEAYEKAVSKAKSTGDWQEVANRLHGMGDWDIQDRLRKFDWFQLVAIRKVATARITTHVDQAETKRVQRAQQAYAQAVATCNWTNAARHLNGFDEGGIARALQAIAADSKGKLKQLRAAAVHVLGADNQRVVGAIDQVLATYPFADDVIPYEESVPLAVFDDSRQLSGVSSFAAFGGTPAIATFATRLAEVHGKRKVAREKNPEREAEFIDQKRQALERGMEATGTYYKSAMPKWYFTQFAHAWMSEQREAVDADNAPWHVGGRTPQTPTFEPSQLVDLYNGRGNGQKVHPFVNDVMRQLPACDSLTYKDHGGAKWAPFCIDIMPRLEKDERGLYRREKMVEFVTKLNDVVKFSLGGDWTGIYNDVAVCNAVNKTMGQRLDYMGKDGGQNWHGALNLHLHVYLAPPVGAPGNPQSAPKLNPEAE